MSSLHKELTLTCIFNGYHEIFLCLRPLCTRALEDSRQCLVFQILLFFFYVSNPGVGFGWFYFEHLYSELLNVKVFETPTKIIGQTLE